MGISTEAVWGMAFVMSPLILLVVCISIPRGQKWVFPLIFIVPFTIHIIGINYHTPVAIFVGIITGMFLYGFSFLVLVLIGCLRKPKEVKNE